ncbi:MULTISPECIES: right-handed parallel beta-helix repeat-containing protein [unclassified Sphingomonas]|uniref:right-handed parallel beta-helix repeat-containing protein n=1 Tax=unclassified Sphingomonas TaxID=196159 RepID=UPI0006FD5EF5|nr:MULTISPECIES: glycosyl hydrolase family 28-related protein [unclassified Sphingomonas]KQM58797.1 hypothetical protein ASE65_10560 [Sphingomonas sp. Leaf16]KQN11052.1 hypothetical protein ASE81_11545 [Sphingomonas sp. Leaf29]
MAQLFTPPFQQTLDANANAISGAKLFFYVSGTTTPAKVYADAALTTELQSPVPADAAGRFVPIYLDPQVRYRVIVADAAGAPIRDVDPIGDTAIADLADGGGSALVGFRAEGAGAVDRTAQAKARETVSVFDFGAKGDGVTDDSAAINSAIQAFANLTAGSQLVFPRADFRVDGRILVNIPRMAILLDGCRIIGNPWRYTPGQQFPFGSFFLVTAPDCDISGTGRGNSIIQLTGGSEANGITFLHTDGGSVSRLTIDGGKEQVTAVEDDTFMTPLSVLNATGGNPSGKWSRVLVSDVELRNAAQYNAQAYGDLGGLEIVDSHLHNGGIANQSASRGAGIAITRGNRGVRVSRCLIEDNKQDGVFQTSAGLDSYDLSITDNIIRRNGRWGGTFTEEANFASQAGQGTRRITIKNNVVDGNGTGSFDSKGGLRAGTYDGVGYQSDLSSSGNIVTRNIGYGWLVQTNDGASNKVTRLNIDDTMAGNMLGDIAIGAKLDATVRWNAAKVPGGSIVNLGDSGLVSNARGVGGTIASASTITVPTEGDVFTLTGTATITTIAPSPGRQVTFVSAGNPTFAVTGNIEMQDAMTLPGNSAVQFVCIGESWFRVGGSINA